MQKLLKSRLLKPKKWEYATELLQLQASDTCEQLSLGLMHITYYLQ